MDGILQFLNQYLQGGGGGGGNATGPASNMSGAPTMAGGPLGMLGNMLPFPNQGVQGAPANAAAAAASPAAKGQINQGMAASGLNMLNPQMPKINWLKPMGGPSLQ